MKLMEQISEAGAAGYILLWLLEIRFRFFLLSSCCEVAPDRRQLDLTELRNVLVSYLRFLTCLRTRRSAFFGPARAISLNFFPFSWL